MVATARHLQPSGTFSPRGVIRQRRVSRHLLSSGPQNGHPALRGLRARAQSPREFGGKCSTSLDLLDHPSTLYKPSEGARNIWSCAKSSEQSDRTTRGGPTWRARRKSGGSSFGARHTRCESLRHSASLLPCYLAFPWRAKAVIDLGSV